MAVSQYANTLQALFQVDINPPPSKPTNMAGELGSKLNDKISGKAGSWLAKGQQAIKTLERKRIEGFVIPAAVRPSLEPADRLGTGQAVQFERLCCITGRSCQRHQPRRCSIGKNQDSRRWRYCRQVPFYGQHRSWPESARKGAGKSCRCFLCRHRHPDRGETAQISHSLGCRRS
jgi:hypothetical protein